MRGHGALVFALALGCAVPACAKNTASTLELAPTLLQLVPGHAALFYLANRSTAPVTVQIDAFDWQQTGEGDRLTPSQTLYASPPFVTIAPDARQTVRVLAQPRDPSRESEYRLIVSQLPAPEEQRAATVRILLQFSIPVFAAGQQISPPRLSWSEIPGKTGIVLTAHNDGAQSVKLEDFRITQNGLPAAPKFQRLGYILPAGTQSWHLDAAANATIHIEAKDGLSGSPILADIAPQR